MIAQLIRCVAWLLVSSALWCASAANAGSPVQGSDAKCGPMSHIDGACQQSRPLPPYSPAGTSIAADTKLDACVEKSRERPVAQQIAACEAFLDSDKGTPREMATAMFYLGHAYTYAGRMDEATGVWKLAAETDPGYREPYLSLGLWAALSADPLSALPYLDAALRIDANDARARTERARAFFHADRLGEALKESEMAVALDPNDPVARQMHGWMLERSGYYAEAAAEYAHATEGYDYREGRLFGLFQDRNPWLEMARALDLAGEPRQAIAAVDAFLVTLPTGAADDEIYLARAKYREHAGNYADAADDLAKAAGYVRDEAKAAALNFRRAILLHKAGSPEKALREMELLLGGGGLQMVLRVQVFLKNAGRLQEINGTFDDATRKGLVSCFSDSECSEVLGKKS